MSIKNQFGLHSIIPFLLLIISQSQGFEPTRNVSINLEELKFGQPYFYFVCPNVRSKTDTVTFYKVTEFEDELIVGKQKSFGIIVSLRSKLNLGRYKCSVLSENNTTRNASVNVMDKMERESPTKFVYDPSKTDYFDAKLGTAELSCGGADNEEVSWYRPPQFHIHSGNILKIVDINQFDFGTYYCAVGPTNKSTVNVKKIILRNDLMKIKEKAINEEEVSYIENLVARFRTVRYRPQNIMESSDVVEWEQPPGTILLDQGRDLYILSLESNQSTYFYRIYRNGDPMINVVGKVFITKRQYKDVAMGIEGRVSFGKKININCIHPSEMDNETVITWKKNNQFLQKGNTLIIPKFEKDSFGKYSCEIEKARNIVSTQFLNLDPKSKVETEIVMTPEPGNLFLYHTNSKKELHCEIDQEKNIDKTKAKDILWTINGQPYNQIDPLLKSKIGRLDANAVSILILRNMSSEHEGTYKCFIGSVVAVAKLIMERSNILIELAPPIQTAADNVNQAAELHCRIDTKNIDSSSITWKFIPEKSDTEINIPAEAKIENPSLTSSTSFLTIDNVLKRHEGTYVCQVLDTKVFGRLIVKTRPVLSVSPKVIVAKPGGTARFLCLLNGIVGKVIWRRMDKQGLKPNKETRMGGSSQSLLEVRYVTKEDDGTVYECIFNNLMEFVTLRVEEECELHQRKCKNDTCIDETKFCDGKDDCGDNSDEDKEKCNECSPNSIHCDFLKEANPTKRCVITHWKCDGIDDCGNNFDELNCTIKNKDKCIGTHFQCKDESLIPRSYWCDGEPDCKSGEDEVDCRHPQVIEPTKSKHISIFSNSSLELVCQMSGRPVPTISWRYNWGHLPKGLDHNITTSISNCSAITSTLIVNDISPDQSGIYSCEGIALRRVMAPDFVVTVSRGLVCKRPFYNNDAWYADMCIRCYCSNVTDDCTSATGYTLSPDLVESGIKHSDAAIVNYKTQEYYEPARETTFANSELQKYYINESQYEKLVPTPDYYFGGAFNMAGSWINRYGYPLMYKLILSGESSGPLPGPMVKIQGGDKAIYYCRSKNRLPVYTSNDKYENSIKIILWEQDTWYLDYTCTKSVSREEFINVLKYVRLILFRVKYFVGQTDFKMSKLSIQEATETKDKYSWVSRLEKCNCPPGYSGLSCEIHQIL